MQSISISGKRIHTEYIDPFHQFPLKGNLYSSFSLLSFNLRGEGISVKRKPQNRPFAGRKTSLDNEIIGSSLGQKFRRSYSTSYDVNESGRRTNSSRLGSSRKSDR